MCFWQTSAFLFETACSNENRLYLSSIRGPSLCSQENIILVRNFTFLFRNTISRKDWKCPVQVCWLLTLDQSNWRLWNLDVEQETDEVFAQRKALPPFLARYNYNMTLKAPVLKLIQAHVTKCWILYGIYLQKTKKSFGNLTENSLLSNILK